MLSGSVKVFTVKAGCALEAITYVDGYGGCTVTDFFPRLTEFCRELGVTMVTNGIYDSRTIVPFREVFHDAVDLGHTYHVCKDDSVSCVSVTKEIGLHSLQCDRQTLAIAKELCITPPSVAGRHGRLLVELLVREELWYPTACGRSKLATPFQ